MGSETNKLDARVMRDEPGVTEIHVENRHVLRDGPMQVECWFSEEDGAYIAQLTDEEPEGRPFSATHTGIGATREEALAHLAVGEYVTALAVATPTPAADGEADKELPREALCANCRGAVVNELPDSALDAHGLCGYCRRVGIRAHHLADASKTLPADVQAVVEPSVEDAWGALDRAVCRDARFKDDGVVKLQMDRLSATLAKLAHLQRTEG